MAWLQLNGELAINLDSFDEIKAESGPAGSMLDTTVVTGANTEFYLVGRTHGRPDRVFWCFETGKRALLGHAALVQLMVTNTMITVSQMEERINLLAETSKNE